MILAEFCEKLTNSKEEADMLYDSDNLYIVWAKSLDDKKLEDFVNSIDEEYYRWRKDFRGEKKSTAKLDSEGTLQGYVYNVDKADVDMFEKAALMPSMKYSYRFSTYNFNDLKEKEKQEIIDTLSEENE